MTASKLEDFSPALRAQVLICPNCHGPVKTRNPTGKCDHLCWPDYLTPMARHRIGPDELERIQRELLRNFGGE
jgi:hypothetical protein